MEPSLVIGRLAANAPVIAGLATGVEPEMMTWRPAPGRWSLIEVLAHLLDEEREDFRARIDAVLTRPDEAWAPIDPQGWVAERRYAERDLEETRRAFLTERERSVTWLRQLETPSWGAAYEHPQLGALRAGDLLASWLAHDLLHIRQMTALHWQFHLQRAAPFDVGYAGAW